MRVLTWLGSGLLLVLLGAVTAEAQQPRPATAPAPRALRIAAASDLQFALEEIVREFQGEQPGIDVKVSYGSSGNFYARALARCHLRKPSARPKRRAGNTRSARRRGSAISSAATGDISLMRTFSQSRGAGNFICAFGRLHPVRRWMP